MNIFYWRASDLKRPLNRNRCQGVWSSTSFTYSLGRPAWEPSAASLTGLVVTNPSLSPRSLVAGSLKPQDIGVQHCPKPLSIGLKEMNRTRLPNTPRCFCSNDCHSPEIQPNSCLSQTSQICTTFKKADSGDLPRVYRVWIITPRTLTTHTHTHTPHRVHILIYKDVRRSGNHFTPWTHYCSL